MGDRIEKSVTLQAPVSRAWHAPTDSREAGAWFRVGMETPFKFGKLARDGIAHPGYGHVAWQATTKAMEPAHLFPFTWHPYTADATIDYDAESVTVVEFRPKAAATATGHGNGFDKIPSGRRREALRMNDNGWTQQMENIRHVA